MQHLFNVARMVQKVSSNSIRLALNASTIALLQTQVNNYADWIVPPTYASYTVLQDTHWSANAVGSGLTLYNLDAQRCQIALQSEEGPRKSEQVRSCDVAGDHLSEVSSKTVVQSMLIVLTCLLRRLAHHC